MRDKLWRWAAWDGVEEPGRRRAAGGGGGGGDGLLHAGPWEEWLWRWGAPAWAVLPSSRPLEEYWEKKKRQKGRVCLEKATMKYLLSRFVD